MSATNTHRPLTTTYSDKELIMANASLKALHTHPERHATVQQIMRWRPSPKPGRDWRTPTFFPWLRIAGMWLEQAGFPPGQRVRIEIQHGRLVITPD
jgi:toxic protein SymE